MVIYNVSLYETMLWDLNNGTAIGTAFPQELSVLFFIWKGLTFHSKPTIFTVRIIDNRTGVKASVSYS